MDAASNHHLVPQMQDYVSQSQSALCPLLHQLFLKQTCLYVLRFFCCFWNGNLVGEGNGLARAPLGTCWAPKEMKFLCNENQCRHPFLSVCVAHTGIDAVGLTHWPQRCHIYHRVPLNSGLPTGVSQSPTAECLHLQSTHHTSPQNSPRHARYSYKTLPPYPPCHQHLTQTKNSKKTGSN